MKYIPALLLVLIILVSGCAGQQAQTNQGAGQQQQAAPAQQVIAVGSGFPGGWQAINTRTEDLSAIGATGTETWYKRGDETIRAHKSVFSNPAGAKKYFDLSKGYAYVTREDFAAGDGAFIDYDKPSGIEALVVYAYKGSAQYTIFYKNTPDETYKSKNLDYEKALLKQATVALLS